MNDTRSPESTIFNDFILVHDWVLSKTQNKIVSDTNKNHKLPIDQLSQTLLSYSRFSVTLRLFVTIIMKFSDLKFTPLFDGVRAVVSFNNGYGASIVIHKHSYGGSEGLYELAVTKNNKITYDTPITDDVVGYLSEEDVESYLNQIETL